MKIRFLIILIVLTILSVSCAAQPTEPAIAEAQPAQSEVATEPNQPEALPAQPLATAEPTVEATATHSINDLYATDPETVSLASGGIQLVEFFSFT